MSPMTMLDAGRPVVGVVEVEHAHVVAGCDQTIARAATRSTRFRP